MSKVELTLEEHISILQHSDLPAIIVEGKDDIIIYRRLEEEINGVVVTPVGGRANVLKIFQEVVNSNGRLYNKNIVFIADQDIWVNVGIPNEFQNPKLIFTTGYSIENDIFVDYCCQDMVDNSDGKDQFHQDKERFIYWYTLAIKATIQKYHHDMNKAVCADNLELPKYRKISNHPENVLKDYNNMTTLLESEIFDNQLQQTLIEKFPFSIRGKSLMFLFTINMKDGTRSEQIFRNIASRRGDCINRIFEDVKNLF